ncbi:PREDICTED: Williams-Beuren syndrome chromosomal region 27 protein-like [Amphimedon queenslandica]|uniref:Methyltransferase type 11 domain-containing protein n=1 Tax=Amphimedon queenslandica TaxID=400682 RepID=A0A1X7VLL2_AMPQE|nr:PREDICTED: Williams-Beuren syndrome chromosomal region 27 protein-like [Amphimedon queenslandica]|eukprot:XP_011409744.1 PREDICTED: Williams-Beuren syndrome chromosomal region 27 protein-like [Amphimedon queenslandica]
MSSDREEAVQSIRATEKGDGSSDAYRGWAKTYDEQLEKMEWAAPKSIVTKWMEHYSPESLQAQAASGRKHRILDAGCGTGLVGEYMGTVFPMDNVELYGGDITPEMLEEVKAKKGNAGYVDLQVIDLKKELPYEEEFFDSVITCGVFLVGHCGPDCLPNIFRVLKKGGLLITTSRKTFYEEAKDDWDKYMKESNCTLLESCDIPYHTLEKGISLVIKKNN